MPCLARQSLKTLATGLVQAGVIKTADILPCQEDNVHGRQLGLQQTKVFADAALDAIAIDGKTHFLLGDNETEAGIGCSGRRCQEEEMALAGLDRKSVV